MAAFANCPARPLTWGVNRKLVSSDWVSFQSGVVGGLGPSSLSAQTYSPDGGRRLGGVGSQRGCSFAGGLIFAHSAKVLTRPYRNVPDDSVSAYCPSALWNQNMYAAMGTTPAMSRVTRRRQPTRLASMPTKTTASSGSPTDLTMVAYPMSRPATAITRTEGRSLQQRITTATVARKMNRVSAVTWCSRCSSYESNSTGSAGSAAPHQGSPRWRSSA